MRNARPSSQAELAERCSLLELKARMLEQSAGQLQDEEGLHEEEDALEYEDSLHFDQALEHAGLHYEDSLANQDRLRHSGEHGSPQSWFSSPPLSPTQHEGHALGADEDAASLEQTHPLPEVHEEDEGQ